MKKLTLVLLFTPFVAFAQPAVDSLKNLLSTSLEETKRVDVLNHLTFLIRVTYPEEAMAHCEEALRLSKSIGYEKGRSDTYVNIGLIYWLKSAPEKALQYGLSALRVSDSIDYEKGVMDADLLLGHVYNALGDFNKSEDFIRQALSIAQELQHAEGIARACNALGNHARRRNYSKEALQYYQMGLAALEKAKDDFGIKNLLLNNIAKYYVERNEEKQKTKLYLDEALQIAITVENRSAEIMTRWLLGLYFINSNEFTKAEEQLLIAEKMVVAVGNTSPLADVYPTMIDLKSKIGKYDEAQAYIAKYLHLKDSLFNLEKAKQLASLEAQYESDKKAQTIKVLEKEKQIQSIWRNVLITGVLLAIVSSYLIYRLQRSKTRKANQLLEVQQLLNEKLTEVDKLKSGFFANISHEFRTPLTLILAPLENELKKKSSAEGKESLLLIRRSANRLLELVNQLLDLSKLESGKMELRIRQGDLQQLFTVIAASFDSLAEHKQITFVKNFDIHDDVYWFDQDKLEKIVANLLTNAFKYTPPGGTVILAIQATDNAFVSIQVNDTGPGIPKEEQKLVFSPFYQTRQSGYQQGTGLGLSLVKELVKLYNGAITLESDGASGTSFTIILPVDKNAFAPEQIMPDDGDVLLSQFTQSQTIGEVQHHIESPSGDLLHNKDSILIVEDNLDLRAFMSATLQHYDYAVLTASDGSEALLLAQKFVPNLVLSDLMMPVMDGMELTKRIKEDERTSHIPVILLTAKNESQSRLEGLKTGADDYLTKPFSPDELIARIKNLIDQRKKLAIKFRERILVSPTPSNEVSLDDKFLNKARDIVQANLDDYMFTVEKMANEMNLSRTQLLRKVKALTGLSPNDFIKDIRLKRAADMIRQKADTITQIGYAVGFNDQSYFTKCFKKQFGVTPSEYSMQMEAAR